MLDNRKMFYAANHNCLEVYNIIDDNKWSQFGIKSKNRQKMIENNNNCEEILAMKDIIELNKKLCEKRLNDLYQTNGNTKYAKLKDKYNINDNYTINKSEFKRHWLPLLMSVASNSTDRESASGAVTALTTILFNDWKLQKSKLTESALKASLIRQLISIYSTTNETEIRESVYNLYLLLCLVISYDNQDVRNLLLFDTNLMIDTIIRQMNQTDNETTIKDSLQLLQFFVYNSPNFEDISQVLLSVISFLGHNNTDIVIHSCHTLLILSQRFSESRKLLTKSKFCQKLLDMWIDTRDERIIKPIFSTIATILPRLREYKEDFLNNENNILQIIPKLVKSSELNKIYANHIIKLIAMKAICAKKYLPTEQIQQIIDNNTIGFINDLLKNNNSFKVKSSALNAIFVTAYNASLDQLNQLAQQDCLKILCSQLDSNNESYLKPCLLVIVVFLLEEFKDRLKNEKSLPNPKEKLSQFATIIKQCDGFHLLNQINERRLHKETLNERYIVSEVERYVEEIMIWSFGVESRPRKRQPLFEVMKPMKSLISCMDCKQFLADTDIFACHHITYCIKCASSAVSKVYTQEPKKCLLNKCAKPIPTGDCPLYMFRNKLYTFYMDIQNEVEHQLES